MNEVFSPYKKMSNKTRNVKGLKLNLPNNNSVNLN